MVNAAAPYIAPPEAAGPCAASNNLTSPADTQGVTYYTLHSNIRHYKVLSIVLGILTFVFAATSFLLAAMQIGQ